MARRILEASGKVDERDSHGCTPLIRASESLRPRLVAFLLASGADHTIRFVLLRRRTQQYSGRHVDRTILSAFPPLPTNNASPASVEHEMNRRPPQAISLTISLLPRISRSSCGCDKDAFMSIGQIDLVKSDLEARSKEELEADRRLTRRILLRAVAYKAVSLAWPPVLVSTKVEREGQGGVAPLGGTVSSLRWRREPRPRKQGLLGAVFR